MAPPAPDASPPPDSCQVDGRTIAYETAGDPTGRPIILCHGTTGSRLLARLLDAPATARGLHIIAPDRPGIGGSDPADGGIDARPAAVEALLAHRGVDSVGVLGFSGGAPYALGCHRLPAVEHVTLAGAPGPPGVGEDTPTQRWLGLLARRVPWLLRPIVRLQRWLVARKPPERALRLLAEPPLAHETMGTDEIAELVQADLLAATAQGPGPLVEEFADFAAPWPVDLAAVSVPVTVVHGRTDGNVPPATAAELATRLPDATHRPVDTDHLASLLAALRWCQPGPTRV